MTDVVIANEVLNALVMLSLLGIIGVFLLKLYNVLHMGRFYSVQASVIVLAVGTISYLFIEIGLFLNLTVEYNVYQWLGRGFFVMIWFFWLVEILMHVAVVAAVKPLDRMEKRKADRLSGELFRSR